jgi:type IV pilus biogenesis protein CpaD/CtpE
MKKLILLVAVTLFLQGCAIQRFPVKGEKTPTIPTYEGTNHFVFWGLAQAKEINPKEVCGKRDVVAVETQTSFVNGLLTGITYGIYSPRNYSIYCKTDM